MRTKHRKDEKKLSIEQQTIKDCPLLYHMADSPCTETCMCWGWEFGEGWNDNVKHMSYELETLNKLFYPKHRVRIQLDQVKEKFGTLTVYHSVVVDHGKFVTALLKSMSKIRSKLLAHDFKPTYVVDEKPYDYDEVEELTVDEFNKQLDDAYKCSNVEYVIKDGKNYKITHLRNYGRKHLEPTKNILIWKIAHLIEKVERHIDINLPKNDNADVRRLVDFLDDKAMEIIKKAEDRCEHTCEKCGTQIGTDWSPSCQTTGWISYICDECAEETKQTYYMNGDLMKEGKVLKTKSEIRDEETGGLDHHE